MIKDILKVANKINLATCIWGSSGYGKTSLASQYGKENGLDLILIEGIAINPSLTAIPVITEEEVLTKLTSWLHKVCSATKPTLLVIDELNRVEHPTVFSMLTSIVLQRQFMLHKIPDCVQIVATCNYESEDSNVREIHDALYKRFCHLEHNPRASECVSHMQLDEEIQEALVNSDIISSSTHDFFDEEVVEKLNSNPRQIETACHFFKNAEELDHATIKTALRGIIGVQAFKLYDVLSQVEDQFKLPPCSDFTILDVIKKFYNKGRGLEIIETLKLRAESNKLGVATVALLSEIPEIMSSLTSCLGNLEVPNYLELGDKAISYNPKILTDNCLKVGSNIDKPLYVESPLTYEIIVKYKLENNF